ncbi:hypothetical protein FHS27_003313 [Rhodopirellula rubra]|uniref:Uncharacterized protein n=1 Tax=Aporhodopirellula rubra TaxID=980271 RepID=A0A7W5H6M8_9BACT|nr:hypothetical protein [Aporhodopirellula rubra]MBB3207488.1 hypothetical protein [Aporhodopirellula rubra]
MRSEEVLKEYCDLLEVGEWGKIWAVKVIPLRRMCSQATSVEDMVEQMAESKIGHFAAVVSQLAENGTTGSHKFRSEANGFKAIAIKGKQQQMYRFPAFRLRCNWVVVYGFVKPRQATWDQKHNDWADTVRTEITEKIRGKNEQA